MIAVNLRGDVLPAQIVFTGGAKTKLPKVEGIHVTTSANHWSTFQTTCEWLLEVIVPAATAARREAKLAKDHPCLLLWDVYSVHRSSEIRKFIEIHMPWLKLVYVPANCTHFLQVADVSLNLPFKTGMKKLAAEWVITNPSPDLRIAQLRLLAAQWAQISLDNVGSSDAARNGIRWIGLHKCWDLCTISHAKQLHRTGHLWMSQSRNDIIAPLGEATDASTTNVVSIPILDIQYEDESPPNQSAGIKRKRVFHCSYCRKRGHTRASCSALKQKKKDLEAGLITSRVL